jgi:hypothetical protein
LVKPVATTLSPVFSSISSLLIYRYRDATIAQVISGCKSFS